MTILKAGCKRSRGCLTYPKPSRGPAMKEFQNNLSHLICVFLHPILETNSIVCWGVKASMASAGTRTLAKQRLALVDRSRSARGSLAVRRERDLSICKPATQDGIKRLHGEVLRKSHLPGHGPRDVPRRSGQGSSVLSCETWESIGQYFVSKIRDT